ncbi:MAG TPA: outer membrane beta-barrel protein, partial [bacterium]
RIAAICAVLVCLPGIALAQPISGLGLFAGLSSTSYTEPGLSLDAGGFGFGVDYQVVLNPTVSINPHLLFVHEQADDVLLSDPFLGSFTFETEFDYTVMGVHVLFWPVETFFIGGGLSNHSVKLTVTEKSTGKSASDTESDVSPGLVAGFATPGGFFVSARYDAVEIQGSDIKSLRVLFGYRFKPQ